MRNGQVMQSFERVSGIEKPGKSVKTSGAREGERNTGDEKLLMKDAGDKSVM
jgi:hypothetical protein